MKKENNSKLITPYSVKTIPLNCNTDRVIRDNASERIVRGGGIRGGGGGIRGGGGGIRGRGGHINYHPVSYYPLYYPYYENDYIINNPYLYNQYTTPECVTCYTAHSQHGKNYEWLNNLGYGKVVYATISDALHPTDTQTESNNPDLWLEHCIEVDHSLNNLILSHKTTFVNPVTKTKTLTIVFESNNSLTAEQIPDIFELEAEYFSIHQC